MKAYAVDAVILTEHQTEDGVVWEGSRKIPTFYLLANVQGIVSEPHAAKIAMDIVGPDASITTTEVEL